VKAMFRETRTLRRDWMGRRAPSRSGIRPLFQGKRPMNGALAGGGRFFGTVDPASMLRETARRGPLGEKAAQGGNASGPRNHSTVHFVGSKYNISPSFARRTSDTFVASHDRLEAGSCRSRWRQDTFGVRPELPDVW